MKIKWYQKNFIIIGILSLLTISGYFSIAYAFGMNQNKVQLPTFIDPEGRFTLHYPLGWNAVPKENSFSSLDLSLNNLPSGSGVVTLAITDLESSTLPIESLVAMDLNAETNGRNNFHLIENPTYQKYNISGYKTGSFNYTFESSGEQKAALDIITKFNNRFLLLIYHANQNDFDKYLPEINRMIDSIRLKV